MKIDFIRDELEEEIKKTVEVDEGTSIDEFLDSKNIEKQEVLVSKNGTIISGRHELEDGDEIKVMDVIAGG